MLTDFHTHILPKVDDGSRSMEESIAMTEFLVRDGVTDIVLTPHSIPGKYEPSVKELEEKYAHLSEELHERSVPVNIYLGTEIMVLPSKQKEIIEKLKDHRLLSLNDTSFILVEFPYSSEADEICEMVYDFVIEGYTPVIAHVERYEKLTADDVYSLKIQGAYIQVNSGFVLSPGKKKKFLKQLIKKGLIDAVSTDIHWFRETSLSKAYKHIGMKNCNPKLKEIIGF